ncbi:MAG: hypothetical protein AABW82_03805 [Nanoarchaeota archaeon]
MVDTLAHAVISFIFYHSFPSKTVWLAILFGILPDLLSWTIFAFYNIFTRGKLGQPNLKEIPKWVYSLYNYTHSLFVFLLIAFFVYALNGEIPIYLWAWPLHILIDIPTHSRKFLPTPFLWPFSDWKFPGISWSVRWFFISYWVVLIVSLLFILW